MTQSGLLKISCLFCLTLSLVACSSDGDRGGQRGKGKPFAGAMRKATPVAVVNPVIQDARAFYETTAALEPESDAKITTRSTGVVRQIFHEEGDDVDSGAILLQLENDDQKLRLKQARQKLENAEREYARVKKMRASGVVASNDFDTAEIAWKTAKTDLELAQLALDYTRIKAPFAGRIVTRSVDLGASVASGTEVFRMMAIHPLLLRVHVPATRIGQVAAGDEVQLQPDSVVHPLTGIVRLVSPIVDPTTGTIKVTIALDNYPESVRPGDFTKVRLATDLHNNAMMVPSVAIIEERDTRFVFVAEEGKAIKKSVKIGFVENTYSEILSGVSPKELIIVKGQRSLADGAPVEIKESEIKESASDSVASEKSSQRPDVSPSKRTAKKQGKRKKPRRQVSGS